MLQPKCLAKMTARQALPILKALSNEKRLRILESVAESSKTISEIAETLEFDQATVSLHVQALEQVGLVRIQLESGSRGQAKRVHPAINNILLELPSPEQVEEEEHEVEVPIGLYTDIRVESPCGFATAHEFVYPINDPNVFHHPKRTDAELIWLRDGYIEYLFPYVIGSDFKATRIEISAEICSETINFNEDYPSDITLWINGVEIGTFRSPGDMGTRYGKLTPAWVPETHTKHGFLTVWSASEDGFWVNQFPGNAGHIGLLKLTRDEPIIVRLGFKEDDTHGGLNIFGAKFGDFGQAILMRMVGDQAQSPAEKLLMEMQGALQSA